MPDAQLFSFSYGRFTYSASSEFVFALLFAVGIIFLFSVRKFGESTLPRDEDDLTTQILPKYLATREQYSYAHMLYVTIMVLIVVASSLLGPRIIGIGGLDVPQAPAALPLFVALVLVGALPNVSWLQELEKALRRFAHERAFIPKAAQADSTRLRRADFDFSPFRPPHIMSSSAMRGIEPGDFDRPRGSVEYGWVRLSCLVHRLDEVRNESGGLAAFLDEDLLKSYASDVDKIILRRTALEDEVAQYRHQRAENPSYDDTALRQRIDGVLFQLYVLLACGVRLRKRTGDMAAALQSFGFQLTEMEPPKTDNLVILALGCIAAIALVTTQLAIWLALAGSTAGLWVPSRFFPAEPAEPFAWAVSLVLAHGSALAVAAYIRGRRLKSGRWFAVVRSEPQRVFANYLRVAVFSYVAGFVLLCLWGAVFQEPGLSLAKQQAPYALLPATTATFFVFQLDSIQLNHVMRSLRAVALQAICTAFFAFVATNAWLKSVGAGNVPDYAIFVAVLNGLIGGYLGWHVPRTAAMRSKGMDELPGTPLALFRPGGPQAAPIAGRPRSIVAQIRS